MKFTIVTPSYNQGNYIERTIQSVLNQQSQTLEIEYLIMDNCSSDRTRDILDFYAHQSQSLPQYSIEITIAPDGGQADAINQAWLKSTGDILAWLNADDVYLDGALRQVADFFQTHPEVMAVYGEAIYIDGGDRTLKPVTNIRDYSRRQLLSHDFITQPSTFIRRQVFETVGLLSTQYRYVFDWEYWIRIADYYEFVRVPILISGYRITGENLTVTGKNHRLWEMLRLVFKSGGWINLMRFFSRLLKKYLVQSPEIPVPTSTTHL